MGWEVEMITIAAGLSFIEQVRLKARPPIFSGQRVQFMGGVKSNKFIKKRQHSCQWNTPSRFINAQIPKTT
jgi:hypothetical protein